MPSRKESVGNVEMGVEIDFDQLAKDSVKLGKFLEQLGPGLKKVGKGLQDVEDKAKRASKETGVLSKGFKQLFGAMTAANLAADGIRKGLRLLKDAFIGSIKTAIDFERQLVQVRKVTNATGAEMRVLKQFIKDLAVETGIAKSEIADIAAGGARLGIFAREGQKGLEAFTRVIVKSRVAMEDYAGSSDEASDKTARLLNLFGLTSKDAEVLLSIINELSNTAAATSSNIADNAESFASLSQSFDASKESILALATTMEEVGSEPQAFGTGLQTALIEMQANTQKFADFLGAELGPKFKETFADEPIEAFAIFLQGLRRTGRDIGAALEDLGIGDRRITRELAKLATDKGLERFAVNLDTAKRSSDDAQRSVDGLSDSASSLSAEFDRASDTTGRRIDSMQEQLSNLGETFGSEVNPALGETVDLMTNGFKKAVPIVETLGEMFGSVLGTVSALTVEMGSLLSKTVKVAAAGLRAPFEDIGLAERGGAAAIIRSANLGGSPGGDMLSRIRNKKNLSKEDDEEAVRLKNLLEGTGDDQDEEGYKRPGGSGDESAKRTLENILKLEGDIAKARRELLQDTRAELLLKRELGVITSDEEKMLAKINRRVEFKNDLVQDLTREWEDMVRELEKVDDRISDIKDRIGDVRKELLQTIDDINKDAESDKIGIATDIAKELAQLEDYAATGTLTGDQSKRLGELRDAARGLSEEQLSEGKRRAGLSEAQLIEEDRKAKVEEATAEADAKIQQLKRELAEEQKNRNQILVMEREKKQAVIDALNDRTTVTLTTYSLLEEETKNHVDNQIEQFNRLKGAISSLASFSASGVASAERGAQARQGFATGGLVLGPGGPTDDRIPAMLSNGEYVVKAAAVRAYRPLLERINAMTLDVARFAKGGPVTNNSTKNSTMNFNYYGDTAKVAADPVLIRWHARKTA